MKRAEKMLTVREVAEKLDANPGTVRIRTVRLWCKQGRFPNAYTEETPFGSYWKIPESDLKNFQPPKIGRPKKTAKVLQAEKAAKKKDKTKKQQSS